MTSHNFTENPLILPFSLILAESLVFIGFLVAVFKLISFNFWSKSNFNLEYIERYAGKFQNGFELHGRNDFLYYMCTLILFQWKNRYS